MTILGIDPGPKQSAWCFWDGSRIYDKGISDNSDMPLVIERVAFGEAIACEHLQCFGLAVGAEVFETAYWIGEFRALARPRRFIRIMRGDVKMQLCNSMRAKDSNIRQALIDRFGAPGVKKAPGLTYGLKADMWSAFAVAVTAYDRL